MVVNWSNGEQDIVLVYINYIITTWLSYPIVYVYNGQYTIWSFIFISISLLCPLKWRQLVIYLSLSLSGLD